ncbi:MAG: transporter substrate-binding domain-containing protein [Lentisphaeria bacterium]|nr:transporter substrate-binding domain-containing protein [Candidatus Neomarinimicrobiota bacterium]MCF7842740.1 transporter substrate-binding domain-containing protein [Lentisphaeria bacterium]
MQKLTTFGKKRLLFILAGILVLVTSIYYCSSNSTGNHESMSADNLTAADSLELFAQSTLARIQAKGELVALTCYNAHSYFLYRGQPMGYDYELLQLLAQEMSVNLRIVVPDSRKAMESSLVSGEGDIIGMGMTVTQNNAESLKFTTPLRTTRQVLVQRMPEDWEKLEEHEITNLLIRNPIDLRNKTVSVHANSAFEDRLANLAQEIGEEIFVELMPDSLGVEALIRMVSEAEIEFTVANEDVALLYQTLYPNINVGTPISFTQHIAWAVRKDSPFLLNAVNSWLNQMQSTYDPTYNVIYNKYFKNMTAFRRRQNSDYFSINGNRISIFDDLFQSHANRIGWDWRLLAAQAFEESRFNRHIESWMGAVGVMQLLPSTGERFGAKDLRNPADNILAGTNYLQWLESYWSREIQDPNERIKFILASYNAGQGHIQDARRLAAKYGYNPNAWDGNVAVFLLKKSNKKYYNDPVVRFGYCRGDEAFQYVKDILERYEHYKLLT